MSLAERNYTVGDQEMLTIVMSYCHWRHYLNSAWHPVEVLKDHHNLKWFMTTKSLMGRQARWWETLSGYNLNMVYRVGKENLADTPSCRPDYEKAPEGPAGAPEGLCAATILTAQCNATFYLWQLYAAVVQEDQMFEDVPHDSLLDLICEGLAKDYTAKEARTALGLPGGFPAKNHSIQATLLCQYQSRWQQNDGLLYYHMQLYVLTAGRGHMEMLRRHHDDPIAGHFGAKHTLELLSSKYYWIGMSLEVKAYTQACSTFQHVRPVWHRPHESMEPLPQPRGPWTDISMDFVVGLAESRRKRHAKPYNAILVVVDRYTKQARYFLCHDSLDAIGLAEILARKLVLRGAGVLQSVVSDRGPQFISTFWAAFCHHLRIY
jgi:hypothetical protein